jgi:5-methylcytosine-specific restriction endonuclease McrA
MKKCTKCELEKSLAEFSKRARLKSGYRSQCKSCDKEHNTKYKKEKADSIQEQRHQYRKENRQMLREDAKRRKHERRALTKGSNIPPEAYFWKIQNSRCIICCEVMNADLKYPDPGAATQEHIIPINHGGPHHIDNLALSHWECNRKKHDSFLWDLIHRYFISVGKFLNDNQMQEYLAWRQNV